jgi:hypothetical protein
MEKDLKSGCQIRQKPVFLLQACLYNGHIPDILGDIQLLRRNSDTFQG